MAKSKQKKRKKFSVDNAKQNAGNTVLESVSALGGALISRGINGITNQDYRTYAKVGMVAAGTFLAAAINGTGTVETISRGASKGMVLAQGLELATDGLQTVITKKDAPTTIDTFVSSMAGLGAGDEVYKPIHTSHAPIVWETQTSKVEEQATLEV